LRAAINATGAALAAALEAAENALVNNPDCAGLFGIGHNSPDPRALLTQIASNNDPQSYFTQAYLAPMDRGNPQTPSQVTTYSMQDGGLVDTNANGHVVIALNYTPGTFNGAGVTAKCHNRAARARTRL